LHSGSAKILCTRKIVTKTHFYSIKNSIKTKSTINIKFEINNFVQTALKFKDKLQGQKIIIEIFVHLSNFAMQKTL